MIRRMLARLLAPRRYAVTLDGVRRDFGPDRQAALDAASKHYRATGRLVGLEVLP